MPKDPAAQAPVAEGLRDAQVIQQDQGDIRRCPQGSVAGQLSGVKQAPQGVAPLLQQGLWFMGCVAYKF